MFGLILWVTKNNNHDLVINIYNGFCSSNCEVDGEILVVAVGASGNEDCHLEKEKIYLYLNFSCGPNYNYSYIDMFNYVEVFSSYFS